MILSGKNWSFKKGYNMDIFHRFCSKIELSLIAVVYKIMSEKIVFRYSG